MATDFFERQSAARRTTKWLIVVFLVSMVLIVGLVMVATLGAVRATQSARELQDVTARDQRAPLDPWTISLGAGAFTFVLIGGGTLFKVAQLRGGGTTVAETVGGHRIPHNTSDPIEHRLVNVVEEMAIASGVPVPPIYILNDEQGINAFAAGYSPSDAVVAVTRGTAEQLSREELQGVVAHEFSHILNGDMRMNIRLIGILHGILLLGLIGRMLFYLAARGGGSRRSGKGGGGIIYILAIGLALLVIGFVGTLIGGVIKAAVSRQREYLADASAVQFTRNPQGISGALKRIGGAVSGSRVKHPKASEMSHMYFSKGVWEGFTGLMATHPPLEKRIRRLDPQWDGKFPVAPATPAAFAEVGAAAAGFAAGVAREKPAVTKEASRETVRHSAEQVGYPSDTHHAYATELLESIPKEIMDIVHEPYGARAVMFALLLDEDPTIREQQMQSLTNQIAPDVVKLTRQIAPVVDQLDAKTRLPLIDLALPALRTMTKLQYQNFVKAFQALVEADERIALFEWTLYQVLTRHLRPLFEKVSKPRTKYYGLKRLGHECGVLFSILAHVEYAGDQAQEAVAQADRFLPEVRIPLLSRQQSTLNELQQALAVLATVSPKHRQRLIEAASEVICHDHDVSVKEGELFRGICAMLDCPMPPLLPVQPLTGRQPHKVSVGES